MEQPVEQKPIEAPAPEQKPVETTTEEKPEEKPVEGEAEKPEEESSVIKLLRRQNRALSKGLNSMRREVEELRGMSQQAPQPATDGSEEQPAPEQPRQPQRAPQAPQNGPNPVQMKITEAEKEHSDFQEHWVEAQSVNLPDAIGKTLMHTISLQKYGSDVLYEVVKDPVILDEFASMHPAEVAARLGEMHAEIRQAKTEPKQKPIPKAPAPITPVGGGGKGGEPDTDKMSDSEYFAYRRKQVTGK